VDNAREQKGRHQDEKKNTEGRRKGEMITMLFWGMEPSKGGKGKLQRRLNNVIERAGS